MCSKRSSALKFITTIVVLGTAILPKLSWAKELENTPSNQIVKWYLPEAGTSEKKGFTQVIVSGKTLPKAEIYIRRNRLMVISEEDGKRKVDFVLREEIIGKVSSVRANKEGYFVYHLNLPRKLVQLPIAIKPADDNIPERKFIVSLRVKDNEVNMMAQGVLTKSPQLRKNNRLWIGAGFNYLKFDQNIPSINERLHFDSFKGPSFFLKGAHWINELWDLTATAKVSPGSTRADQNFELSNGSYNWYIFALEGIYYPTTWKRKFWSLFDSELGTRFGTQYHKVPFVSRIGTTQRAVEIVQNDIYMATAGLHYLVYYKQKITLEMFLRYQHPISSGDTFAISPIFAFDGSVGMMYHLSEGWNIGAFWYGQFLNYDLEHYDKKLEENVSGNQSLFFSNFDIRLGFHF